jgi:tRNA uridine 5-carboxymethylaminomethyl modification enzyme
VEAENLFPIWPELADVPAATMQQLAIDAQYAVYLERQKSDVEAVRRDEQREIPEWLDYNVIPDLSIEVRQRLTAAQPQNLAQAQAIEGVTPAAITLLLSTIRRGALQRAG